MSTFAIETSKAVPRRRSGTLVGGMLIWATGMVIRLLMLSAVIVLARSPPGALHRSCVSPAADSG